MQYSRKGGIGSGDSSMGGISRRSVLRVLAAGSAVGAFGVLPPGRAFAETAISHEGLTGRLVFAGSPDYETARLLWDRLFVSYPLVIVFCETAEDVVNAVTWSRRNGVGLRARSGGHSLEGWSTLDGGVVVDVSSMKQVSIDAAARIATVGTGLNQGEIVAALAEHDFAIPTGAEASVGIGGVTLGGGIGFLSRSMGVTCDSLIAVDIVVPDGSDGARMIRADKDNHADLLWACRGGGGGNFGIATAYTFRLHEEPDVTHIKLDWDWSDPVGVFNAWQGWAPHADVKVGSTFVFLPKSSGVIEVECLVQATEAEAERLVQPLLSIGQPALAMKSKSHSGFFEDFNSGPRQLNNWRFTSSWLYEPLPEKAIATIVDFMGKAPAPGCNYWCLNWGGATRNVPEGGAAFFHRDPLYYAEPGAGWDDPGPDRDPSQCGWRSSGRRCGPTFAAPMSMCRMLPLPIGANSTTGPISPVSGGSRAPTIPQRCSASRRVFLRRRRSPIWSWWRHSFRSDEATAARTTLGQLLSFDDPEGRSFGWPPFASTDRRLRLQAKWGDGARQTARATPRSDHGASDVRGRRCGACASRAAAV